MIDDKGTNNRVIGAEHLPDGLTVRFIGSDNEVRIGSLQRIRRVDITVKSSGTRTVIGDGCRGVGSITIIHNHDGSSVDIGGRMAVNGNLWIACTGKGRTITIGEDCLIATVRIRNGDHHRIFAIDSDEEINPPTDIAIGNHVWLGEESLIIRGASVGNGSIIGARALVNSAIPENVIAAGSPARILREGIRWEE